MSFDGSCRCGACRYVLDADEMPAVYACHCLDCQTMTGGAVALQAMVPAARLAIEGELIEWSHPNARGHVTVQRFCGVCKTRLYSTNEGRPGVALLRAGTLAASANVVPVVHMWVRRKQPWIVLAGDVEAYEESIPADRLMALIAPNFA